MRRKIALFGLALVLLIGCAASFTQIVYREQTTSLSSYKMINDTLTDLRANGLITDQGWIDYSILANKFLDAHKNISTAMAEYKRGQTPQGAVELAQRAMLYALDQLKKYYISKVPKDQQKPLF